MAEARDILAALDALAEGFQFPGFDNANYESVDARMHSFCAPDGRWSLLIEEAVDWAGAGGPMTLLFGAGPLTAGGPGPHHSLSHLAHGGVRHDSLARCGTSEPSDELQHLARQPLGGGANRTLLLYRRAEEAREAGRVDEAVRLFDEAASRLIEAVDGAPDDPEAPRALLLAGQALLGASRPDAAARTFARARDLAESLPAHLVSDHVLAVALFQLGEASRLADDAAAALAAWSRLTDEERFARSADPEVQLIVQDAAARLPVVTAR